MNRFEGITRPLMWIMALLLAALVTGCGGGGTSAVLNNGGAAGGNATAPTVTAVVPLANAAGVAINLKKFTAAFSMAMDPATLSGAAGAANFKLACPAATPVTGGVVTYLAAGNIATLTVPAANLPVSTLCTATITTAVKDSTGVALAGDFVWSFTTGTVPDTIAPTVTLTVPVDGVTGVATNALVTATFSEAMDPALINVTNFTLVNTTAAGATVAGAVSYAVGSKIATFTPTAPLAASALFTATLSTAVTDLAGNPMAVNKVWTFTTGAAASTSVTPGIAGTPGASTTNPTVNSSNPSNGAINVATSTNGSNNVVTGKVLTATFSQPMNPATITPVGVFTLKETVAGTNVAGSVVMNTANTIATFTPTVAALTPNTFYSATVSTAAKTATGTAIVNAVSWGFKTGGASSAQMPVNLGLAGNYAIFALTGIANATPPAAITGDMGVGPGVTSTAITGFALTLPAGSAFSTSAQVAGKIYAFDYANPTPVNVTTAAGDMGAAYNDAAGRLLPDFVDVATGNLAGQTLTPGLHRFNSNVTLPFGTNVTLNGGPDDIWIIQITGTLVTAANTNVFLSGGAQAKNIFWQVAGTNVTLGATAHVEGVVLAKSAINFGNKASANSNLLAQTAVNLDQSAVTQPAP